MAGMKQKPERQRALPGEVTCMGISMHDIRVFEEFWEEWADVVYSPQFQHFHREAAKGKIERQIADLKAKLFELENA